MRLIQTVPVNLWRARQLVVVVAMLFAALMATAVIVPRTHAPAGQPPQAGLIWDDPTGSPPPVSVQG